MYLGVCTRSTPLSILLKVAHDHGVYSNRPRSFINNTLFSFLPAPLKKQNLHTSVPPFALAQSTVILATHDTHSPLYHISTYIRFVAMLVLLTAQFPFRHERVRVSRFVLSKFYPSFKREYHEDPRGVRVRGGGQHPEVSCATELS